MGEGYCGFCVGGEVPYHILRNFFEDLDARMLPNLWSTPTYRELGVRPETGTFVTQKIPYF